MTVIRQPHQVFDVRLVERYRTRGLFKEKDLKKFLTELPDMQENADYITAEVILGKSEEKDHKRD